MSFSSSKEEREEIIDFWKNGRLGAKLTSQFPTHYFVLRDRFGFIAGTIVFNVPIMFSKIVGEDSKHYERYISAINFVNSVPDSTRKTFFDFAVSWMVDNTQYRVFTTYSSMPTDEARQYYRKLGFYRLKRNGKVKIYKHPFKKNRFITDRTFRSISFYKRYAEEACIDWEKNWNDRNKMLWFNVPLGVKEVLKITEKYYLKVMKYDERPCKTKFVLIKSNDDKQETELLNKLLTRNRVVID